jgi:hypothetical protein
VTALEARVGKLTERLQHSEQDAAAARVLAGGADRDVDQIRGELRDFRQATTSSFNALREDLTDLRKHVNDGFTEMRDGFTKVEQEFAKVDRGFTEMRGKFDATAAGQQQIVELLNTLIVQQSDDQPGNTER